MDLKNMGGKKIDTQYFSVIIPENWCMPQAIRKNPAGISALFGTVGGDVAVTLNVFKAKKTAREIAGSTIAQMRKAGLKTAPLQEKNGMLFTALSGKAKGVAWFAENNGICGATMILGANEEAANVFLQALKPKVAGIIPASVN